MKISKFVKVNLNILLEYVYDDTNLISDSYEILLNSNDNSQSYIAGDTSASGNTEINQLFRIDPINNRYGIVNPNYYNFLQTKDYASGFPIAHDTIIIHVPVNWTFGEYLGFYIKAYTYDFQNQNIFTLSNFFFDMTDVNQQYLMNYTSPPLFFQEKQWGKQIAIQIPSVFAVSAQRQNGASTPNTINSNLTNGVGLSLNSPIFIDFSFITNISLINGVTSYTLGPSVTTTVPQAPDFEKLGVVIQESTQGDFFEIFGVYNNSIAEFSQFIDTSVTLGNNYYVEYDITIYEQNIAGSTKKEIVTDNFDQPVEFRPIIKYSTTTAVIDVQMNLIDAVDGSTIVRNASYGMLQNQLSKYGLFLMKINLGSANVPVVYNLKTSIDPSMAALLGLGNGTGVNNGVGGNNIGTGNGVTIETVKVPYPVLIDKFNIVAKSDSIKWKKDIFFGIGKLSIVLYPFDNIIRFTIATNIQTNGPQYMDLTNLGELNLVIKNTNIAKSFGLFRDSGEVNLSIGLIIFKIDQNSINDIRKIYDSGINLFYITSTAQSVTTTLFTGLFMMYDSQINVNNLNKQLTAADQAASSATTTPSIIIDQDLNKATAIITRKITLGNTITPAATKTTNLAVKGIVPTFPNISNLGS